MNIQIETMEKMEKKLKKRKRMEIKKNLGSFESDLTVVVRLWYVVRTAI